jgi:hypothetical protein
LDKKNGVLDENLLGAVTQNLAAEDKVPENVKKLWGLAPPKIRLHIVLPNLNGVYATLSSARGNITGSNVLPVSPYVSAPTYGMTLYFNE